MTNLSEFSSQLADTVEAAAASLVTVHAMRPISGSVVGEDLILTVAHVLHGDEVTVGTPDGRRLGASVVGRDPGSDLALLRVEGLNLPALGTGPAPRVGELLLAVGRPERGPQASLGLVRHAGTERGWLPAGAEPFPGISGGALVDVRGALVGVLNAGTPRRGLLAVPAARALKVADLLAQTGRVPRGYLGLATQPVVLPGPAQADTAQADMGQSDTEQDGAQHGRHNPEDGRGPRGLWERGPWGGPGPRGGGPWGKHGPWNREDGDPRMTGRGRGRDERGRPGGWGRGTPWPEGTRLGLTAVQVEAGSPTAQAGLKIGDILLSLDGEGLRHPRELMERVQGRAGETLTARILRGGEEQDVTLTIGER
ncbi:S1C family serine protease [uncultured Deinococcus sp.]|uniref:S1C family serine protease n=1 Tax=uncultured Deinococcus sp. TaxID=158789 RepID=UPI00374A457B